MSERLIAIVSHTTVLYITSELKIIVKINRRVSVMHHILSSKIFYFQNSFKPMVQALDIVKDKINVSRFLGIL